MYIQLCSCVCLYLKYMYVCICDRIGIANDVFADVVNVETWDGKYDSSGRDARDN